jgi:hypothetical protein
MEPWLVLNPAGSLLRVAEDKKLPGPTKAEQADFFSSLGRCFSAWQMVEASLYSVATSAVQAQNIIALAAMFHSQRMFRGKLDSVNEVMKVLVITKKVRDAWTGLHKKLGESGEVRNKMTHGQTFFDPARERGKRLFISGRFWDHKNMFKAGKRDVFTSTELQRIAKSFSLLDAQVWIYGGALREDLSPPIPVSQGLLVPRGLLWDANWSANRLIELASSSD